MPTTVPTQPVISEPSSLEDGLKLAWLSGLVQEQCILSNISSGALWMSVVRSEWGLLVWRLEHLGESFATLREPAILHWLFVRCLKDYHVVTYTVCCPAYCQMHSPGMQAHGVVFKLNLGEGEQLCLIESALLSGVQLPIARIRALLRLYGEKPKGKTKEDLLLQLAQRVCAELQCEARKQAVLNSLKKRNHETTDMALERQIEMNPELEAVLDELAADVDNRQDFDSMRQAVHRVRAKRAVQRNQPVASHPRVPKRTKVRRLIGHRSIKKKACRKKLPGKSKDTSA